MNVKQFVVDKRHQFRLVLFGHKAAETAAVCMFLMVQGNLAEATLGHFLIATRTGMLTVFPLVGLTLTKLARHFANRWTSALMVAICAFAADAIVHGSHYPGAYTEAILTGLGAFVTSVVLSYTPVGKQIDRLAEVFLH